MLIPGLVLKQMYTMGSLENVEDGVRFSLKTRLSNATLTTLGEVRIDGQPVPLDRLTLELNGGRLLTALRSGPTFNRRSSGIGDHSSTLGGGRMDVA